MPGCYPYPSGSAHGSPQAAVSCPLGGVRVLGSAPLFTANHRKRSKVAHPAFRSFWALPFLQPAFPAQGAP